MNNKNNLIVSKISIILFAILIILIPKIQAFGVTSPYWKDAPLIINEGETKDIELELQNMVGKEEIILKAEIKNGKEIAELTDSSPIYIVPLGKKDIKVKIKISIPKETKEEKYELSVLFKQIKKDEEGTIQFSPSITKSLPIIINKEKVIEKTEKKDSLFLIFPILIMILTLIITVILLITRAVKRKKISLNQKNIVNLMGAENRF